MIADPSRKTTEEREAEMLEKSMRLIDHLTSVDSIIADIKSGQDPQEKFEQLKLPLSEEQQRDILEALGITWDVAVGKFLLAIRSMSPTEGIILLMLLAKEVCERKKKS